MDINTLWLKTNAIPQAFQPYWKDNEFSKMLITQGDIFAKRGYALHFAYPTEAGNNPLNIAECKLAENGGSQSQLAVVLVNSYKQALNLSLNTKRAHWVLLTHILLDNTICFIESDNGGYKDKVIATRNLFLANNVLDKPIDNFPLFYAIISNNVAVLQSLKQQRPELMEILNSLSEIGELISAKKETKANLAVLSDTFKADVKLIKAFIDAYRAYTYSYNSCVDGKCGYIKLKALANGKFEFPARVQGTCYNMSNTAVLTPLTFLITQATVVCEMLNKGIVYATFKKVNNSMRTILASNNPNVLNAIYKDQALTATIQPAHFEINRGYIRIADLCGSKYDKEITRAITLNRITAIQYVEPNFADLSTQLVAYGYDPTVTFADLAKVVDTFKTYIDRYRNSKPFLELIYNSLTKRTSNPMQFGSTAEGIIALNQHIDTQMLYSSSYARYLHSFMIANTMLFPGYTGKPEIVQGLTKAYNLNTLGISNATNVATQVQSVGGNDVSKAGVAAPKS